MTITEVGKLLNISANTLRYYERIGLIPKVNRDKHGFRDYAEEDLRWIEFIKCMRSVGLSIETLTNYVALFQQGDRAREARKQILAEQLGRIEEQKKELGETLEQLSLKIAHHEQTIKNAQKYLVITASSPTHIL